MLNAIKKRDYEAVNTKAYHRRLHVIRALKLSREREGDLGEEYNNVYGEI